MSLPLPPVKASGHVPIPQDRAEFLEAGVHDAPETTLGQSALDSKGSPTNSSSTALELMLVKGQSLYQLFAQHGIGQGDLVTMVNDNQKIRRTLRKLRPGQVIIADVDGNGRVERIVLERPGPSEIIIERDEAGAFSMHTLPDGFASAQPVTLATTSERRGIDDQAQSRGGSDEPDEELAEEWDPSSPKAATLSSEGIGRASLHVNVIDTPSASAARRPGDHAAPKTTEVVTIRSGDSLYAVFRRLGASARDLARLMEADKKSKRLRDLRPGQELTVELDQEKSLQSLTVEMSEEETFKATRSEESFTVALERHPLERRVTTASAVIENSLFLAGQREGLSDRTIMELTEIFGWDVDFALDVRAGDRFTVVYEELLKDGKKVRNGPILASEFFYRGRSVRAIRYEDESGRGEYFSPEGLSMRKAFLRTPVNFTRISSRFSQGRLHPVLQRMRAHKGVDYVAPRGTPIKATGDGRVVFAGRKGGYGRAVILQHGSTYTTVYAHLSRLHNRARSGQRIRQGEIIGYVGSTGLATGPHLHYEFRVRGVHVDPLRVKLPKALPIEARYKQDFLRKSRPLVAKLDALANTNLTASN